MSIYRTGYLTWVESERQFEWDILSFLNAIAVGPLKIVKIVLHGTNWPSRAYCQMNQLPGLDENGPMDHKFCDRRGLPVV